MVLYRDELESWRHRLDLQVTVDHADRSWDGHVGLVTELIGSASFDPSSTLALMCGPEVMMRHAARGMLAAGVGATRIRVSMERNMKCAIGHCGHCQFGPRFV